MQVIVPTAARFGVSSAQALHDPQVNLLVSARYLKTLQMRFNNRLPLVLAAYNAGEGAVGFRLIVKPKDMSAKFWRNMRCCAAWPASPLCRSKWERFLSESCQLFPVCCGQQ